MIFEEATELKKIFAEEQAKVREQLALGSCEDYSDYKFITGVYEGLPRALLLVDNYESQIIAQIKSDNDDDDF